MKNRLLVLGILGGLGLGFVILKSGFWSPAVGPSVETSLGVSATPTVVTERAFLGEKGELVVADEGKVLIPVVEVSDGRIHYFHADSSVGKTIYFFVVQAEDGTFRAAANACEVCFDARRGFRQEGELIICENCGQAYPKERIGLEKGGCNPAPISGDLPVKDGQLVIETSLLTALADLF